MTEPEVGDDIATKPVSYWLLAVLALVVLALYAAYWYGVHSAIKDLPSRGQFGDMFGGVNALFTALAFAGLIFTAALQRRELELQRLELKATRTELANQSTQLAAQHAVASRQLFENTFFQLVRLHHQIVEAIRLPSAPNHPREGRTAFETFNRNLGAQFATWRPAQGPELDAIRKGYDTLYEDQQRHFGHYFRNLYHIVRFVDRADPALRTDYIGFLRAQLSAYELVCLFYNCLSQHGDEKFKPLVEKYALFNNLPLELLHNSRHVSFYGPGAFVRTIEPPSVAPAA